MNFDYTKQVKKRFFHPRFMGEMKNADGIGKVGNPTCGDVMYVYLEVDKNKDKKDFIKDIKFKTMGCCAAIASSDAVCEIAKGKTIEQAKKINRKDILKKLGGLPPVKYHCSLLGEDALMKAIKNYEGKKK